MHERLTLKNQAVFFGMTACFAACYALHGLHIPGISSHITNFSITGTILCLSVFSDLRKGVLSRRSLYGAVLFWALLNILMEIFVRVGTIRLPGVSFVDFNTPDPLDAIFGLLGIAIFLVAIRYCSTTSRP